MLGQKELAFIKAISTMQLSPVILKVLRLVMCRLKRKPAVLAGIRSTTTGSGPRSPNDHLPSSLASVKPTSWQARAGPWSPQTRWPGPSPRFSQLGRASPQPWIQTRVNPLSHPRQSTGACLSEKSHDTTTSAKVNNNRLPAGERPNKTPFLFQVYVTPVPSWFGCGRLALAV